MPVTVGQKAVIEAVRSPGVEYLDYELKPEMSRVTNLELEYAPGEVPEFESISLHPLHYRKVNTCGPVIYKSDLDVLGDLTGKSFITDSTSSTDVESKYMVTIPKMWFEQTPDGPQMLLNGAVIRVKTGKNPKLHVSYDTVQRYCTHSPKDLPMPMYKQWAHPIYVSQTTTLDSFPIDVTYMMQTPRLRFIIMHMDDYSDGIASIVVDAIALLRYPASMLKRVPEKYGIKMPKDASGRERTYYFLPFCSPRDFSLENPPHDGSQMFPAGRVDVANLHIHFSDMARDLKQKLIVHEYCLNQLVVNDKLIGTTFGW